ncbi:hypothetical protein KQI41_17665 [Tissierella pigra]|uniref:Transcriptional regulator HTH-type FeoC domain-containing protein n=1 Tax=Tissierella pigra TaxID=2607614 RepID=A0A6N7XXB4_9FIRM|nr:hypothetical protein [Tissierella pigra]MBU5428224.1 hypothetical protein [Tissierella pigra]MSU02457.1 hypothetical protein [Tissierella pigra]
MLKDVLKELSEIRVLSTSLIAKKLNTSEALVEEIIQQLYRMEYIKNDEGCATSDVKCSSCAYKSMCTSTPIKTISITDKGKTLLKKL